MSRETRSITLTEVRNGGYPMSRSTTHDANHEEILREIISELEQHHDLKGWAIISQEGLIIEHRMPPSVNPHLLAGNAAALAHSANVVIDQTDSGNLNNVLLEGERHLIMIIGGEERLIFFVMAGTKTDLKPIGEFLLSALSKFHSQ